MGLPKRPFPPPETAVGEVRREGLNRAQGTRALQALVPDMSIVMPAGGVARGGQGIGGGGGGAEGAEDRVGAPGGAALAGQGSRVLHELKVISCNSTRYKPSWQKRAVDVRALKLPTEYLGKARTADRRQGVRLGRWAGWSPSWWGWGLSGVS